MNTENQKQQPTEFPQAQIKPANSTSMSVLKATKLWWLTLICVLVSLGLVYWSSRPQGTEIQIHFDEGHGLKIGDALKFKGIDVGTVKDIQLSKDSNQVDVTAVLFEESKDLAHQGCDFWVVRPQVSLSKVSGLETVVGARYVQVRPSQNPGPLTYFFKGMTAPPTIANISPFKIHVNFDQGHGLKKGDLLLFKGIEIGEVTEVSLEEDLSGVQVTIQLVKTAQSIARTGTLFWIERPSVSLSGVRGLDTIIGGRYVTLLPGPENTSTQLVFKGLPEAPPILDRSEGGLEIILEAQERNGLQPSSPVTYRGISVGYITSVGLASDAGLVEARAYIQPKFRHLVREDSMFWAISGVEVELGFTGVKMNMESLQTITAGGVAFRTPKSSSANATTGKRFELATEVEPQWLEWEPQLAVGTHLLPGGLTLPSPARASLNWSERNYVGLLRDRQRDGWILPLTNSKLISLSEMLSPVEGAHESKTTLAVEGQELSITKENSVSKSGISIFTLHSSVSIFNNPWPSARLRGPKEPEDCILWISASEPGLPIAQGRMEKQTDEAEGATPYWQFKQELSFEESWNGASVISRNDGKLIGFLNLSDGNPKIIPLPEKLFSKS